MKIAELAENRTAACVLVELAFAEVGPHAANQLHAYGCFHVDAHH
jgi:hypothetical protein